MHWDGVQWSTLAGITGHSVSGTGPKDVWIGHSSGLQHFNGTTWSQVPQLQGSSIQSVVAIRRHDVWVAATNNGVKTLVHFDDNGWTVGYTLPTNQYVQGLGAVNGKDVWAAGSDFLATSPYTVGLLLHFDGATWQQLATPPAPLTRVERIGHSAYAVGQAGQILRLHPNGPTPWTDLSQGPVVALNGTWGSSPDNMWAVGEGGTILHYRGGTVRTRTVPSGVTLNAVWGTGPHDVWVVGHAGTALHYTGSTFQPFNVNTTVDLFAVFTAAPGDVWIGGAGDTLLHVTGTTVTAPTLPGAPITARIAVIHGIAPDDIWLGGQSNLGGFVSHWDGASWSPVQFIIPGGGSAVTRLWEVSPDNVWTITPVGAAGMHEYLHFDGTAWTTLFSLPTPDTWMFNGAEDDVANSSFAFSPDDVWSVGIYGAWRRRIP